MVSSSFHFAVHAIFHGDQFREAVIRCWSSLCRACQLHPVRWAPIRLNNYWKNVSASTGRLAIMSCKLGEKSLLPHWYRQHQGAQTFTAVTGLGKQPDSDVYVFGPNLYFSSNGDLIAENQRRRNRSAKVMSRGLKKILVRSSEVHPGAGWRGALNYTPFWAEIGQKCVHVEQLVPRLYMTGRGRVWPLTLKINFFPVSQNTTGESEQQQIKFVWPSCYSKRVDFKTFITNTHIVI